MITPIHILFDIILYFTLCLEFQTHWYDLTLILSVNLIDLDHLFSRPIYKTGRNSFKTHFLHKHWKWLLLLAAFCLLNRYALFAGIGIISHLLLDWIDVKMHKGQVL